MLTTRWIRPTKAIALAFQFSQAVLGGLGRRSVDNHALDIGVLVGDTLRKLGALPTCRERVIAVRPGHADRMRRTP
jgi:hypothetical protein